MRRESTLSAISRIGYYLFLLGRDDSMLEMTKELASELGLEQVDGGWEPREDVELTILLASGPSGPVSLSGVSRIVTCGDGWILQMEENDETAWVRCTSIVLVNARRSGKSRRGKRTGFA